MNRAKEIIRMMERYDRLSGELLQLPVEQVKTIGIRPDQRKAS